MLWRSTNSFKVHNARKCIHISWFKTKQHSHSRSNKYRQNILTMTANKNSKLQNTQGRRLCAHRFGRKLLVALTKFIKETDQPQLKIHIIHSRSCAFKHTHTQKNSEECWKTLISLLAFFKISCVNSKRL